MEFTSKFTSTEAKQRFGDLIAAAMHHPVTITNHGKPRVVVVSVQRMEEMQLAGLPSCSREEALRADFKEVERQVEGS